ncbi:hypothetical protein E9531_11825 [Lampropedia puyangensis]|uniref:Uncharacterized protein n=1 Tax=Lampropedia puyangensis TaxID=1330072 RepID=A0A4S8F069_9BURK|nr:hypothetical protein [Lampropedia puyangensis]THT99634.1 hypothetical protein E9531_11825 [Lampropedia puyangensis]
MIFDFDEMFGRDAGETEKIENLKSYFLKQRSFSKFINENNNFLIASGRKGMGKSALLKITEHTAKENEKNIVISIKGNELLGLTEIKDKSHIYLENHWKKVICKKICMHIGSTIKLAINDDDIYLVENAEIENFKDKNLFSSIANRLGDLISNLTGINPEAKKLEINNYYPLLKRKQEKNSYTIWLIVDDIDAKFKNTAEFQDRVSAFFTATFNLANSVSGLIIRTSIRSDVWSNLRSMEDQDKLREFLINIKYTQNELDQLVSKRISSYIERKKVLISGKKIIDRNPHEISKIVFEDPMRWNGGTDKCLLVLRTLAGHRPRWIGQLCKIAGEKSEGRIIRFENIIHAMDVFGRDKISDITKEHIHQFSEIEKLINSFRSKKK